MPRRRLLWATALGIGLMTAVAVTRAAREGYSYTIPREAETKVIEVMLSGGLARTATAFEVSGDGTLSMFTLSGYASGTPQLVFSEQLAEDDFLSLVSELVDAGVMDYDERAMNERFRGRMLPTDQGGVHVTLRLETYEGRALNEAGYVERRFSLEGVRERARQFPELGEIAAVARLLDRLSQVARLHTVRPR